MSFIFLHHTFSLFLNLLFVDPNIEETGNQIFKSNHGPKECCYEYCNNDDGLCTDTMCEALFNHTAIDATTTSTATENNLLLNSTKSKESNMNTTPNLFVKLDDGTYVLNDFSHQPALLKCPALPSLPQSTQQCSVSQAQAASSATSLYSLSVSSSLTSLLMKHVKIFDSFLKTYISSMRSYIVASLTALTILLIWNFISFIALRNNNRNSLLQRLANSVDL